MANMKNAQYAFWEYDKFPYVLGGEITRFVRDNDGDKVEVIKLGKGYWIKPYKIVYLEKGLEIQAKLDKLTQTRRETLAAIEGIWKDELDKILLELK